MGHRLSTLFWQPVYRLTLMLLWPLNIVLVLLRRNVKYDHSVLHISAMVHVPYYMVQVLRQLGYKADYLAVSTSTLWNKSDYVRPFSRWPHLCALKEFQFFWLVEAKYEVIHSHFMKHMSLSGWELPLLKRLGRKLVIHYRGCEIRDREKNMSLHPDINICQACDYQPYICRDVSYLRARQPARTYGDLFLVTTPDMRDFVPEAVHLPFFVLEVTAAEQPPERKQASKERFKIVHATVHPGIEGTAEIQQIIEKLREKGYAIDFAFLHKVPYPKVLDELADADLSVGKMKMGYYANFQIESMLAGVPAVTYVRPEFMTDELKDTGFIFTTLADLEDTLEYYLTHPEALEQKRRIARESVLRLHDNDRLGRRLIGYYEGLRNGEAVPFLPDAALADRV